VLFGVEKVKKAKKWGSGKKKEQKFLERKTICFGGEVGARSWDENWNY
jgi:hypothetical protein